MEKEGIPAGLQEEQGFVGLLDEERRGGGGGEGGGGCFDGGRGEGLVEKIVREEKRTLLIGLLSHIFVF